MQQETYKLYLLLAAKSIWDQNTHGRCMCVCKQLQANIQCTHKEEGFVIKMTGMFVEGDWKESAKPRRQNRIFKRYRPFGCSFGWEISTGQLLVELTSCSDSSHWPTEPSHSEESGLPGEVPTPCLQTAGIQSPLGWQLGKPVVAMLFPSVNGIWLSRFKDQSKLLEVLGVSCWEGLTTPLQRLRRGPH